MREIRLGNTIFDATDHSKVGMVIGQTRHRWLIVMASRERVTVEKHNARMGQPRKPLGYKRKSPRWYARRA